MINSSGTDESLVKGKSKGTCQFFGNLVKMRKMVSMRNLFSILRGADCPFGLMDRIVSAANSMARSLCDAALCASPCDYGYKTDARGCGTCECDNPCDQFKCPSGQRCVVAGGSSAPRPVCKPIFVPPCAHGKHLTNLANDEPINCQLGAKFGCPSGYNCFRSDANDANFCCPEPPPAGNERDSDVGDGFLPSICQLLKDAAAQGLRTNEPGYQLALKNPRCTPQVSALLFSASLILTSFVCKTESGSLKHQAMHSR